MTTQEQNQTEPKSLKQESDKRRTRRSRRLELLARIQVRQDLVSMNQLLRQTRMGVLPSTIARKWREFLTVEQLAQLGQDWMKQIQVDKPHPMRRLEIIRRCKRRLDEDGAYAGLQPILNALKSKPLKAYGKDLGRDPGWFYDDSPKYVHCTVTQIVTGDKPWLEISLFGEVQK